MGTSYFLAHKYPPLSVVCSARAPEKLHDRTVAVIHTLGVRAQPGIPDEEQEVY